jgi:hypothetical protein
MAGSLVLIQETTISSSTASVSLVGIDSTFNVYKVVYNNVTFTTSSNTGFRARVTVSGTADTTSNYDRASMGLKSIGSVDNNSATNETSWDIANTSLDSTVTGSQANGILYCFNFSNSSEFSFITKESSNFDDRGAGTVTLNGSQGGAVNTVAQACDGIQFFANTDNIAGGIFKLYGLVK